MGLFDLVFIVCFLAAVVVLGLGAMAFAQGNRRKAFVRFRRLGMCVAIYMAVVVGGAIALPREVYHIGDTRCFDDWCIAVTGFRRAAQSVEVELRLSSRARRTPQGEKGTVVYLSDAQGHRYDPEPDAGAVRFDTLLQPGESVITRRRFGVSNEVRGLNLIYTHEGGFPIGAFIIGQNTWFHGPPVVRLE